MPESRTLQVVHCGEELRGILAGRRRKRQRLAILVLIGGAAAPLALVAAWKLPTLLVWNASASAPIGLYRVSRDRPVRIGDMVVARMPEPSRSLAAKRRYLPSTVPMVKRVAAAAGDRVCAAGAAVSINGARAAIRLRRDSTGRSMPWWTGCRWLGAHEYFLLMKTARSFDGRYFGVTRGSEIIGRAELLWEP